MSTWTIGSFVIVEFVEGKYYNVELLDTPKESQLMKYLIAVVLILVPFAPAIGTDDITIERLFGPEIPGKYKHPASITELDNGDLYVVYYGGEGEYEGDTAVYGSRLARGSTQWTRPKIIADTPGRSEGNAVVWQAPDGIVWLCWNRQAS